MSNEFCESFLALGVFFETNAEFLRRLKINENQKIPGLSPAWAVKNPLGLGLAVLEAIFIALMNLYICCKFKRKMERERQRGG